MNKITMFQRSTDYVSFGAGQIIFSEGDAAECMYVVLDGQIEISIEGRQVQVAEAGDAFGEMALIEDTKRSATAKALTESKLVPDPTPSDSNSSFSRRQASLFRSCA